MSEFRFTVSMEVLLASLAGLGVTAMEVPVVNARWVVNWMAVERDTWTACLMCGTERIIDVLNLLRDGKLGLQMDEPLVLFTPAPRFEFVAAGFMGDVNNYGVYSDLQMQTKLMPVDKVYLFRWMTGV